MDSTALISATLEGQTSNLGDTVDQLEVQVGQGLRPAFVLLLTAAGQFLDFLKNCCSCIQLRPNVSNFNSEGDFADV